MNTLQKVLYYLLLACGVILIAVTLLSLIYNARSWMLKVLDFPRIQVLLALLSTLLLFLIVHRRRNGWSWFFLFSLTSAMAMQVWYLYPYTPLAATVVPAADPTGVSEESIFDILVVNVLMTNDQAAALLRIIQEAEPDVVLAMETNDWWIEQLEPLTERYPFVMVHPLDNTYGMALYSRLPLEDTSIRFLNHPDVPSFHGRMRLPDNAVFNFHAMHPVPPMPMETPDNMGEQEVALLKVGKMVAGSEGPTMVFGDFNDVAWSYTSRLFGQHTRLGDIRVGRWFYNSFDAHSLIWRWPIDHIFVSTHFRVLELERLRAFHSDHFPIYARLTLTSAEPGNGRD